MFTHSSHPIPTPRTARGRRLALAAAAAAVALPLALAGCTSPAAGGAGAEGGSGSGSGSSAPATPSAASTDALLQPLGLDGLPVTEVIDRLDALPVNERPADLIASIRPDALVLTDQAGAEAQLPMPKDRFYLSIAPYVEQTHECHFHSLTTCLGELGNSDVSVTVTDAATGKTVVDEQRTTADNGFLGVWVPRGPEYTVRIERDGAAAETRVNTDSAEAATCLTTMQLTAA